MPDNYEIADQFSLLSKVMDIHGENSFKSKSYSIAAYNIEQLNVQLSDLPREKIAGLKGIGDSTGKKIAEILDTGKLQILQDMIVKTPPGVLEMLNIKGIGPKKIALIWKEMELESLGELLYACQENRLMLYKGFGEKTQQNVMDAIEFYMKNQGHFLYAEITSFAEAYDKALNENFTTSLFSLTGAYKRQLPVIEQLEWITTAKREELEFFLLSKQNTVEPIAENMLKAKTPENISIQFTISGTDNFHQLLIETSSSPAFNDAWKNILEGKETTGLNEDQLFSAAGVHYIPSFRRETGEIISFAKKQSLPSPIQASEIKGIVHSHSTWSDGSNSLEEMSKACIEKGLEYLVISDHSKSAFYAKGLSEERIKAQHEEVDELNIKLAPFKIFKSIESDILNDGSLDYADAVLATFDLVIASVHSNLKMSQEKAMMRLLKAIENPFTTILGHMTGRLLLSRNGYPVDHEQIIDACVKHQVVIELNAHPRRLDIDWSWINLALDKGAMISIDPDAHTLEGYNDIHFGVQAAQKSLLTKEKNLSSLSRAELESYLEERRRVKGT